jgi:hypothetical protein
MRETQDSATTVSRTYHEAGERMTARADAAGPAVWASPREISVYSLTRTPGTRPRRRRRTRISNTEPRRNGGRTEDDCPCRTCKPRAAAGGPSGRDRMETSRDHKCPHDRFGTCGLGLVSIPPRDARPPQPSVISVPL